MVLRNYKCLRYQQIPLFIFLIKWTSFHLGKYGQLGMGIYGLYFSFIILLDIAINSCLVGTGTDAYHTCGTLYLPPVIAINSCLVGTGTDAYNTCGTLYLLSVIAINSCLVGTRYRCLSYMWYTVPSTCDCH